MNITSTMYTQNIASQTVNNKKEESFDPYKGENYELKTLDQEGNELLNQVLDGKSDQEKWMLKLSLDMALSTEVKNNTLTNITNIDNSKANSINQLEAFINERKRLAAPDMLGTAAMAEKLLEAYKKSASFMDIVNQEDIGINKSSQDLYSKNSTLTASSITKENIKKEIDTYHKTLVKKLGDSDEAKTEISKKMDEYKKEMLTQYEETLRGSETKGLSLEQQAVIKILSDENLTNSGSSLTKLLVT